MKLLFLSGAKGYLNYKIDPYRDPSFIYRLHNPAISALKLGHKVGIKHILDLTNPFISKNWDIAIIHRPSFNKNFIQAFKILKNNNIPVFGDFDDLIFSIAHASDRPSVKNGIETLEQSSYRIKSHLKAIELIDGVITSNKFLSNMLTKIGTPPKNIIVMNNSWHFSWLYKIAKDKGKTDFKFIDKKKLYLSYFSGTRTHDLDLSLIVEPLKKVLNKHKNLHFLLIGKGTLPGSINEKSVYQKKIHFSNYHNVVSKSFVNLAPLESTAFNNAKSALKIIEAGFFGVKTVCSPTPDYYEAPKVARNVANSNEEWERGLNEAIENGFDPKITNTRIEKTRHHYHPLTTTKKFILDLETIL